MTPVTESKPLTFERVSPRVTVALGAVEGERAASNATIVVGDAATLVVDTMVSPGHIAPVKEEAERLGGRPVDYVLNSHGDPDHMLGNALFDGAVVVAHRSVAKLLEDPERLAAYQARLASDEQFVRGPDIAFDTTHELDLGGVTVKITYVGPAHSVADSLAWVEEERVLIAADTVFNGLFPLIREDLKNWSAALTLGSELEPDAVIPGHGPVGDRETLRWQRELLSDIERAVKEQYAAGVPLEAAKGSAVPPAFARLPLARERWPGAVEGVYRVLDDVSASG